MGDHILGVNCLDSTGVIEFQRMIMKLTVHVFTLFMTTNTISQDIQGSEVAWALLSVQDYCTDIAGLAEG